MLPLNTRGLRSFTRGGWKVAYEGKRSRGSILRGIIVGLTLIISIRGFAQEQGNTLFAYVGTGIKEPVIELANRYKKQTGVTVEMTFNNSGTLVGQLSVSKRGDIFMPGSMGFVKKAEALGLISSISAAIAYHVPVIIVPKTNPAGISGIQDFTKKGVALVLPDRESTALGKSIFKVFDSLGIRSAVEPNILAFLETPQKVVTALSMGQGDAGVVDFSNVAKKRGQFSIIEIPRNINVIEVLPCATLSCSEKAAEAEAFKRFVEKEGPAVFAKHGFKTAL